MKTPMQQLKERLFDVNIKTKPITLAEMDEFIAKEKDEIIDSFNVGYREAEQDNDFGTIMYRKGVSQCSNAENYYNYKFNEQKNNYEH